MGSARVTPPSQEEEIFLVSRRFSIRMKGNKIEDAVPIEDDDLEDHPDCPANVTKKAKLD